MPSTNPNPRLLAVERLSSPVRESVRQAAHLASSLRSAQICPAHLALALLLADDGVLDRALCELLGGLRAATLAEVVRDVLELAAEPGERPALELPAAGLPEARCFSAAALQGLAAADEHAPAAGLISPQGLAAALFRHPDAALLEALGDAGVTAGQLTALAEHLALAPAVAPARELFSGGQLDLGRFGGLTRAALSELSHRGESARPLRDVDLLYSLLRQETSRLARGLHLLGASVRSLRRQLETMVGESAPARSPAPLVAERMSGLLRRVFERAAELAAGDGAPRITESHLVRAHLERVTTTPGHLYERWRVDPRRLQSYLEKYFDEPEPAAAKTRPADLAAFLGSRVLHQQTAVERVVPALKRLRIGLGEPGRPLGAFLFLGPTGVGKTELARAMAEAVFDTGSGEAPLIKIDCGKLVEKQDIVQLIGARQGLVGYKEGQLTNGLRARPEAVVLFDEAEKAHADVWQSLLSLFDEGIVQEADGTEYDATRCVLVATSNIGYRDAIDRYSPFAAEHKHDRHGVWRKIETDVERSLKDYFSPEFLARFGQENMVYFRHFGRESYTALARQKIDVWSDEMRGRGLEVEPDEEVVELLGELAWRLREEGARPVRRLINEHLRGKVVDALEQDPARTRFCFSALPGSERVVLVDSETEGVG